MESHSKVTLPLLLLCLAFSVDGARVLLAPDASTTPEASPSPRTGGSAGFSNSPKGSIAMKNLEAEINGQSAKNAVHEAVKYVTELDALSPTESVTNDLVPAASAVKNGLAPAASAVMNRASAMKNELAPAASAALDKAAAMVPSASEAMHKASAVMGPAASAAMNKAAAWAAELKGPSAN